MVDLAMRKIETLPLFSHKDMPDYDPVEWRLVVG